MPIMTCRGMYTVLAALLLCASVQAADRFPTAQTKKGLQVQMIDDAIRLGIGHAALNVNLCEFIDPHAEQNDRTRIRWIHDGRPFFFIRRSVENLDQRVRSLSTHGILVYLILLTYEPADADVRRILLHPNYHPQAPHHLGSFNTTTDEGRQWLAALMSFFAHRWSRSRSDSAPHGRVAGYIVGNEVNSHWFWANQGEVTEEDFTADYERTVRIIHRAVRSQADWPRVYLSLEHHWSIRYPGGTPLQAFPGRSFLERFAALARRNGDFDWHLAFHPYPEDLSDPRFWEDETATDDFNTPRITLRNLPVLTRFLQQEAFLFQGTARRVILSEQGFHTPEGPDGEILQAAAFCLAWHLVSRQDGIDAFILHRHVDHAREGGLRLGLWTHRPGTLSTPERPKRIYECFQAAGTDRQDEVFRFALPIVGRESWNEPGTAHDRRPAGPAGSVSPHPHPAPRTDGIRETGDPENPPAPRPQNPQQPS